jgi:hypothetical protein
LKTSLNPSPTENSFTPKIEARNAILQPKSATQWDMPYATPEKINTPHPLFVFCSPFAPGSDVMEMHGSFEAA